MRIPIWLDASFSPIVDATLRGALILLVALMATRVLRRRSAAARHAIWAGAIAAQLLLVVWAVAGPRWPVGMPSALEAMLPPAAQQSSERALPSAAQAVSPAERATAPATRSAGERVMVERVAPSSVPGASPSSDAETQAPVSWREVLLVLWALGAIVVLFRLVAGTAVVAALARRGTRVVDGSWLALAQRTSAALRVDRPLTLLRGDRIGVPVTWGIVYPVVLLPADSDAWPEERRRFVLVHEMAHVKRFDALTQLVGQIVLALFWFNPLVWIANRRMQLEREHACDDYVLRHGTSPTTYAEELLAMVRALGTPQHRSAQPAFAALAMARRSEFEGRMLSILDPVQSRHPVSRGRSLAGVLAALLVVVPLAALRPYRQHATPAREVVADTRQAIPDAEGAATDEFPRSFKVHIDADTGDATKPALATALAGTTQALDKTSGALSAMGAGIAGMAKAANQSTASCANVRFDGSVLTSTHSHIDDDESRSVIQYVNITADRCREATLNGKVTFNDAETDVASMAADSRATFRERSPSDDRELDIRRGDAGLTYAFRRNGVVQPYDDEARRWFAGMLPAMMREASINVGPRVRRLRAEGGVEAVLAMTATMHSSGAKRAHYMALLDDGKISEREADLVVRQARRDLSSSGDLRAVLVRVAPMARGQSRSAAALEEAAIAIPSSGDRTAVLMAFGQTTDRDMLSSVMRAAETIPSSGDKSRLLAALASRYFDRRDAALRTAFFRTLSTVPSSGDLRRVLNGAVMGYAASSEPVALGILATTSAIGSSGDRTAVLLRLADSGALRNADVRESYMKAAQGLTSSDLKRVLTAAAR